MADNPTKLKIDLSRGLIEMEGNEDFVQRNLQDVKEILTGLASRPSPNRGTPVEDVATSNDAPEPQQLLPGFDSMRPRSVTQEITSEELMRFLEPLRLNDSEMEYVTAFVYYLLVKLTWPRIEYKDIEECYRLIERPVPLINKAVNNASFRKKWLDMDKVKGVTITREGRNRIEHPELPSSHSRGSGKVVNNGNQARKVKAPAPIPKPNGDLDLWGTSGKQPFKEFANGKSITKTHEKVAVSAYYLTQILNQESFDERDIFTCFEHMKWPSPSFMRNNIINHKNQFGFYSPATDGRFVATLKLKKFVEHEIGISSR